MYIVRTREGDTLTFFENPLVFLEKNIIGKIGLKCLTSNFLRDDVDVKFFDTALSMPLITPFLANSKIDVSAYYYEFYHSFNEFYSRRIRPEFRPVNEDPELFVSPCDGAVSVHDIDDDACIENVPEEFQNLTKLLRCKHCSNKFRNGKALIYYIEARNYHRYIYFDNGTKTRNKYIDPIFDSENLYVKYRKRNDFPREYTTMQTENFGEVIQLETGLLIPPNIENYYFACDFKRGHEKGLFKFGGSVIVLLFQKDKIIIDEDIVKNSAEGIKTFVMLGEPAGRKYKEG